MSKIFALLALLLIATGVVLMVVPKVAPNAAPIEATRGLAPEAVAVPAVVDQARALAEQVNAPLSILFGLVSLFYSRRSYHVNKERADAAKAGRSV